jgi:hypothetical protein
LFLSRHIPYLPSDPLIYTPPYPISPCNPIIPIICHSCHVRFDHYHVIFAAGPVQVNLLVQGEDWDGPLLILRWVAANSLEIVGECEGKDFEECRIVHFLVFMHFRVHRPEDLVLVEGVWRLRHYPDAPDSRVYLARAHPVEELPLPGPLFTPTLSISPDLSSIPSPNGIWATLCLVCLFLQLIPNFLITLLSHFLWF